jgi:Flp pilus assembly protein TadD
MKKTAKLRRRSSLREMSFEQVLATVRELADARRDYGGKSRKERRAAAEWAYDSGMAHDLFSRSLLAAGGRADADAGFDSGVMALAIDPLFAPALLTVGSLEYQYKRRDAAMAMFLTLTTLPPGEPDLAEIIDKAGCFLLDQKDTLNATRLYRAATEAYPGVCEHWSSLSYCLGKAGQLDEAVATARKALSLKESDPRVLNDLGWTLVLAGFHDEARSVLERAMAVAPADYDLPQNNLRELDRRVRNTRCAGGKIDGEAAP